jgi:hypothetical protein
MPGCERPHNRLVPLRWNNPIVDLILDDDRRCTLLRHVTAGDDLRWISAYKREGAGYAGALVAPGPMVLGPPR